MISMDVMSTRGRSSFVKLTLLAVLTLFVLLLLLTALHNTTSPELRQYVERTKRLKPSASVVRAVVAQPVEIVREPVDKELVEQLEQELPEVDYGFWSSYAKPRRYRKNSTCALYPDPLELQLHNTYWQTFINGNVTFRLYAAYMDMRPGIRFPLGVIRILGTANQIESKFPPTYCQLWYADHKEPIMTKVSEYLSVWIYRWGHTPLLNYPHLLSCPIPDLPSNLKDSVPRVVSLVTESCDRASNSLRIHYDRPSSQNGTKESNAPFNAQHRLTSSPSTQPGNNSRVPLSFGVCVKALEFPYIDLSERLVEWFEMQRLLGASRIYAYMYDVHPAVQRVLNYYQRINYLELRPLTQANGMPRLRHYHHQLLQRRRMVKRLNELIPFNDCFYRNMYRHDYLLNADIDEVIIPQGSLRSWQDVLDTDTLETRQACPNGHVSLCFINSYFTKVVPEAQNHEQLEADELYVLQHILRHRNYSNPNRATKCLHNTRYSLTLHNHFTLKWLPGGCNPRSISTKLAHMQHYREPDDKYELSDLVEDRTIWKYASELRAAVDYVWTHLNDVQEQDTDIDDQNTLEDIQEQETDLEEAQEQRQMLEEIRFAKATH